MTRLYSGIYRILNIVNNKQYIGSAVHIRKRWKTHIHDLLLNKHHNIFLQKEWNQYGKEVFQFKMICLCKKEELLLKEQEMMDLHQSYNRVYGYNICPTAGNCLGKKLSDQAKRNISEGHKGIRFTEEHKQKLRESNVGQTRSLEARIKMSKSQKEIAIWKDHTSSEETRQKISKANTGKIRSEETKEILSKATISYQQKYGHPSLGRHHSEETKELLSQKAKVRHTTGYHWSKEARERVSKLRKGRIITPEWRLALSKAGKNRILSKETRQKLGLSATKRWEKFKLNKVA